MWPAHPAVLSAALALVLLAGCAHAPSSASASAAAPPEVVVTGSRLPQRLDLTSGLPPTTSPVVVRTRQELDRTGEPDPVAALRRLTP